MFILALHNRGNGGSKMKKTLVSMMLCTAMATSLFVGCGNDGGSAASSSSDTTNSGNSKSAESTASAEAEGSTNSKYKDFITVDVYDDLANYQGMQSGWFAKVVKDKFNMELNIIARNVAGGGDTLYQTRSAAGDLGDLIVLDTSNGKLNDLVDAGLVYDCTELVKDKDVYKNYQKAIEVMNGLAEKEGIWAFPQSVSSSPATEPSEGLEPTFGPYLRWDYYKEMGYPKVENMNGLLDILEDMQALAREKEGANDIYALSFFKDWDGTMMNNAKQLCCMYGYDEIGFILSKADGSEYVDIVEEGSIYEQVLQFFYEANQRGLVDPDSTTQNYDTLSTKYANGKILYCPWPWLCQAQFNTEENKAAGKGYMYVPVDDMQIFSFGNCPEGNTTGCLAIGSGAEDPERLLDFIDWLYSPEGVYYNQAPSTGGIPGLTWEVVDGKPQLTEYGKSVYPSKEADVPEEYGGGTWKDGVSALNFKTVSNIDIDPSTNVPYQYDLWEKTIADNSNTALIQDWQQHMGAKSTTEYLKSQNKLLVAPGCGYTAPTEDSNIATLRGQCKATVIQYSWQMIFAKDQAEFDSYAATMRDTVNGLGYADVLAIDMQNAKDQTAARAASAAAYPSK